jgi:subtilisin family serine protease
MRRPDSPGKVPTYVRLAPVRALVLAAVALAGLAAGSALALAGPGPAAGEPGRGPAAAAQGEVSLIVRLAGPSLAEMASADRRQAARAGAQPMSTAQLRAARDGLVARQAPAARAIAAAGAVVVAQYQGIINGFLVHARPREVAAIARVPGVVAVDRAPMLRAPALASAAVTDASAPPPRSTARGAGALAPPIGPQPTTGDSVPWIGAPRVWRDLGWRGDNALVAVLDTGIDYTHDAFGGPGTEKAYNDNNEDVVESGSFPTARVVGGYDLAGRRYSPDPQCGAPGAGTQECYRTPRPDDDPLDSRGNGTHVAGIIAGQKTAALAEGVAPGARLVPLKIFGNPVNAPVVTDLLVGAFDWVVNNNLQLTVPGFATAPIDVVFIGLSDDWLSGTAETERVIKEASDAGLTVIVAFGNRGPQPYMASAAGSASYAVSVGSTYPPGEHGMLYEGTWSAEGQAQRREGVAIDSQIVGQPDAFPAGFAGNLASMDTACNDVAPEQPVQGKVALVLRGDCGFAEKMTNAQAAGAIAAVVYTTGTLPVQPMGGAAALRIPGVMIDYAAGQAMRDALKTGTPVALRVWEPTQDLFADVQSAFANRGPARDTAGVKPQMTAPGQYIVSAWPGAKTSRQTGTSMGAAHVAGTAALLAQRKKAKKLDIDAAEIGALLVNYASPSVRLERADVGPLAPVTLEGAGRVDAWKSATGNTVVRSDPGIAELSFGHVDVTDQVVRLERTLYVHNLAGAAKTYAPRLQLVKPEEDGDAGVSLAFDPPRLTVAGGKKGTVKVTLTLDPAHVRPWALQGREAVQEADLLDQLQVDGWVYFEEVDTTGSPVAGGDRPAVPFLVLPRRGSCVVAASPQPFRLHAYGDTDLQRWTNACAEPGVARVYTHLASDAVDSALPAPVDLTDLALRYYPADPANPESDVILDFALHTRGSRRLPQDAQVRVYVDLDRDGVFDEVLWSEHAPDFAEDLAPGRWIVVHGYLPPGKLDPAEAEVDPNVTIVYQPYNLDETTTHLLVSADDLGIDLRSGGELFNVAAQVVDTRAEFAPVNGQPAQDSLPDNLSAGGAVVYDQLIYGCITPQAQVAVPGSGEFPLALVMACDPPDHDIPVTLFLDHASNAPGPSQFALRPGVLAQAGGPTPTPTDGTPGPHDRPYKAYLPVARNK